MDTHRNDSVKSWNHVLILKINWVKRGRDGKLLM